MTDKTISKTWMFCGLLIFIVVIYFPTLNGGFYHDDRPNLVYNNNVQIDELTLDELITASTSSNAGTLKRPISMMSFALNYHFFGDGPTSFRITNLIIHFANSILIFFIVYNLRRLTNTSLPLHPLPNLSIVQYYFYRNYIIQLFRTHFIENDYR